MSRIKQVEKELMEEIGDDVDCLMFLDVRLWATAIVFEERIAQLEQRLEKLEKKSWGGGTYGKD